jgi:predicted RNase H-like nuclease (RuvC/YqgF family)
MGRWDCIRGVAGNIGGLAKRVKNDATDMLKEYDKSDYWSIAKEIGFKIVPGTKWLPKSVRKPKSSGSSGELKHIRDKISRLESENSSLKERVSRLESGNSSLKERVSRPESENSSLRERVSRLESENSSLKGTRERVSRLESEISSMREERNEWQQERITLMASMLALATHAETKSWKTRALLLTVNGLFLPSDHSIIVVEAKPEDCIQP